MKSSYISFRRIISFLQTLLIKFVCFFKKESLKRFIAGFNFRKLGSDTSPSVLIIILAILNELRAHISFWDIVTIRFVAFIIRIISSRFYAMTRDMFLDLLGYTEEKGKKSIEYIIANTFCAMYWQSGLYLIILGISGTSYNKAEDAFCLVVLINIFGGGEAYGILLDIFRKIWKVNKNKA